MILLKLTAYLVGSRIFLVRNLNFILVFVKPHAQALPVVNLPICAGIPLNGFEGKPEQTGGW